jgi:hypothetical protein
MQCELDFDNRDGNGGVYVGGEIGEKISNLRVGQSIRIKFPPNSPRPEIFVTYSKSSIRIRPPADGETLSPGGVASIFDEETSFFRADGQYTALDCLGFGNLQYGPVPRNCEKCPYLHTS